VVNLLGANCMCSLLFLDFFSVLKGQFSKQVIVAYSLDMWLNCPLYRAGMAGSRVE